MPVLVLSMVDEVFTRQVPYRFVAALSFSSVGGANDPSCVMEQWKALFAHRRPALPSKRKQGSAAPSCAPPSASGPNTKRSQPFGQPAVKRAALTPAAPRRLEQAYLDFGQRNFGRCGYNIRSLQVPNLHAEYFRKSHRSIRQ